MSETRTARPWLARFCNGMGVDIGAGGDPIVPSAITIDKLPPAHLVQDAASLPFMDNTFNFIYSSHCLEDFEDTPAVLREWMRVLKPGGNLVLFLPDQQAYLRHCEKHGVLPNQDHKHPHFSIDTVMESLIYTEVKNHLVYYEWPCTYNPYSFALAACKV